MANVISNLVPSWNPPINKTPQPQGGLAGGLGWNPKPASIVPKTSPPQTAIKKISVGADGSQTIDYHKPDSPQNSSAGNVTPITGVTTTPSGAQVNATTGQLISGPPSFGGIVGSLYNTSMAGSAPAQDYTSQLAGYGAGNIDIGNEAAKIGQQFAPQIQAVQKGMIGQEVGDLSTGTAPVGEGAAQLAAQAGGQELQGLASAEGAALQPFQTQLTAQEQAAQAAQGAAGQAYTGLQLKQGGLNSAGNLAYPMALTPPQYLVSPTDVGSSNTGQGAGYANATNWAQAQNNMSQGGSLAQQATQIKQNLDNYGATLQGALQTMTQNGLNLASSPFFNTPINQWIGQFKNPAAVTALNAYMNDLKNFQGALIQSGVDLTPTGTQGQVLQTDPSALTPQELQTLAQQMQYLGQIRYTTANTQAQQAYSAASQPGQIFTGGDTPQYPQQPNPTSPTIKPLQGVNWLQYAGGEGLNVLEALGGVSNIGGGTVGGVLEGLGASLLKSFLPL